MGRVVVAATVPVEIQLDVDDEENNGEADEP